jgi:hypothetical protein
MEGTQITRIRRSVIRESERTPVESSVKICLIGAICVLTILAHNNPSRPQSPGRII